MVAVVLLSLAIVHFVWTTGTGCGAIGFLDHASLMMMFLLANEMLQKVRGPKARSAGRLALIGIPAVFLFLDTLHFRFFHTWGDASAFRQWEDIASIWSGLGVLWRPADLVFYVAGPLAAWALLRHQKTPTSSMPALLLSILVLSIAHGFLASPEILYSENDPLMYALRRQAVPWQNTLAARGSAPAGFATAGLQYQLINSSLYESAGRRDFPLLKIPVRDGRPLPFQLDKKPNVVLILMESVRAYESGAYGASASLLPNLDRLAGEGILFKNFYANSYQTARGEFAIHSSYVPAISGSPEYIERPFISVKTWPSLLRIHGYGTLWIGSYPPAYDDKQKFLSNHGIGSFFWKVPKGYRKVGWGPSDEDLFNYAFDVLSTQRAPYFAEIMTLSDHYPWPDAMPTAASTPNVAGEAMYQKYAAGMFYTDYAIGKFMDRVRASRSFDDTLFIFCGDHGIWLFPDAFPASSVLRQEAYFRVPLILWSRGLRPRVVTTPGSQIDIGPTVLDLLGLRDENTLQGTSLFRHDTTAPFILMSQDGRWNMRRGNVYAYDVGPELFKDHYPFNEDEYERLIKNKHMQHVVFSTDEDLLRRTDTRRLNLITDPGQMSQIREFAQGAFDFYRGLLVADKIAPKEEGTVPAAVRAGIQWVSIPGGSFVMGDDASGRSHKVNVKPFQMAKTMVTNGQYKACVDAGTCTPPHALGKGFAGADQPVVGVDWKQAHDFSQWVGGRLPSEAEWEYAARSAGKARKYPWGNASPTCEKAATAQCKLGKTAPVCSTPKGNTDQGLCDMAGDAWEWTQDWYHDSYNGAPTDGTAWENPRGVFRVLRGGAWNADAGVAKSSFRYFFSLGPSGDDQSFRPAR